MSFKEIGKGAMWLLVAVAYILLLMLMGVVFIYVIFIARALMELMP